TPSGPRARRTREELGASDGPALRALEALIEGRLLVARDVEGGTACELAHEALIGGWATLRGWLDGDGDRRQIRGRIEAASAEWQRLGGAPEALWRERQLAEAARVDATDLGDREQ